MTLRPSPPWLEPAAPRGADEPRPAPVAPVRRRPLLPFVLVGLTFLTTMQAGAHFGGVDSFSPIAAFFSGDARAFVIALVATLWTGLPYAIAVMAFFLAHELGHYIACRRYGVDSTLPHFIPAPWPLPFGTLGAVIRIRSAIPSRKALFDIGVAGPIAGFVVAIPLLVIGTLQADLAPPIPAPSGVDIFGDSLLSWGLIKLLRPDALGQELIVNPVFMAGWLALLATAMNLVPAGQLDGGHIVYALAPRWHRAIGLAAGSFLLGLVVMRGIRYQELSAWLLWTVVVFVFGRHHPPVPEWEARLGPRRISVALLALVILVLSFMPVPLLHVP